jgi:hypothetical protein
MNPLVKLPRSFLLAHNDIAGKSIGLSVLVFLVWMVRVPLVCYTFVYSRTRHPVEQKGTVGNAKLDQFATSAIELSQYPAAPRAEHHPRFCHKIKWPVRQLGDWHALINYSMLNEESRVRFIGRINEY